MVKHTAYGGQEIPAARGLFSSMTAAESKLLKKCLGDADGNSANNVEVYDWDYGTFNTTLHPHIVKLVPQPNRMSATEGITADAGKFYLVWYDDTDTLFYTANMPDSDQSTLGMTVFTTTGVATMLTNSTTADPLGDFNDVNGAVTAYWTKGESTIYTSIDTSCYTGPMVNCLSKGDKLFLFDGNWPFTKVASSAENTGDMYTVVKIGVSDPSPTTFDTEDRYYIVLDKIVNWDGSETVDHATINVYLATGTTAGYDSIATSDATVDVPKNVGVQRIVKFVPGTTGNYEYVSQCSGRGICDSESGLCQCFTGYTDDNCDTQSALAV
jgi:hypothetical protein